MARICRSLSVSGRALLQFKDYRDRHQDGYGLTIAAGGFKAPASHGFDGGLVQLRVSGRALHLDVFHLALLRNAHFQEYSALDSLPSSRLRVVRFHLITAYGAG